MSLYQLLRDFENFMSLFGCFHFWVLTHFPEVICPRYDPGMASNITCHYCDYRLWHSVDTCKLFYSYTWQSYLSFRISHRLRGDREQLFKICWGGRAWVMNMEHGEGYQKNRKYFANTCTIVYMMKNVTFLLG